MKIIQRVWLTIWLILLSMNSWALDCPESGGQQGRDIEGEINGNVDLVLKYLGHVELDGVLKSVQKDFYHKYPHAAQLATDYTFIAMVCSGIRDDDSLTEKEKWKQLMEFREKFVYRKSELIDSNKAPYSEIVHVVQPYTTQDDGRKKKQLRCPLGKVIIADSGSCHRTTDKDRTSDAFGSLVLSKRVGPNTWLCEWEKEHPIGIGLWVEADCGKRN